MTDPTRRQRQVLRAILRYQLKHGFAPTIRELANGIGVSSTNAVFCHLDLLERKGLVRRDRLRSRTLQLTVAGLMEVK